MEKRWIFRRWVMLAAVCGLSGMAIAQPDSLWSRQYGQHSYAWGISALQTADGGLLLGGNILQGNNWDFLLVKTEANGDTAWMRPFGAGRYGGGGYLCSLADGGYLLAGTTEAEGFYLLKVTANGDSVWSKQYGAFGTDNCTAVVATRDGGFLLAGYRAYEDRFAAMILKVDANGDSLWSRQFGGPGLQVFYSVNQTPDGGYICSGMNNYPSAGGYDMWLVRTDSLGFPLWQHMYGGRNNEMYAHVQACSDGGFVLAGTTNSYGAGIEDVWLLKTNAQGDSLWSRTFGGPNFDECSAVTVLPDGGIALGARTMSYGPTGNNFWLIRTDANGDSLWSRVFGTDSDEWCNDVLATSDGGFVLLGGVDLPANHYAMWLVKTGRDPVLSAGASFSLPPSTFSLSNYPNPFNSSTWVSFDLPKAGNATLKVFDVLGREVVVLRNGPMPAGSHRLLLDGAGMASGSYVLRLEADGAAQTKKMTLLK
ncbi:MAG TPA: T9SS type A sorting domain-containing protein [bacterium]|jgi:hypothetical protein